MKKNIVILLTLLMAGSLAAQNPVTLGQAMHDFELQSHDGQNVSLEQLKGKNVLLVFPRGKVGDHWCQICHYQYAELAKLEAEKNLRKKYDLEIVFVLPYTLDVVKHWVEIFPAQMEVVEGWKNPPNQDNLDARTRAWMMRARALFPHSFVMDADNIPAPFPILADGDRALSMNLGLFTTYWDRSYVEQNISTVYLLDKEGTVLFKYHGQSTFDRPKPDYLIKMMDCLLMN